MKKINTLQTLRMLAFAEVFLGHSGKSPTGGNLGVSIFIILSGFCMAINYMPKQSALPNNAVGCVRFSVGKIKKLYFLHVITALAAIPLRGVPSVGVFIANILLLQSLIPRESVFYSLNGVVWYLSSYMFICMAAPFVLKAAARVKSAKKAGLYMLLTAALMAAVGALGARVYVGGENIGMWLTYICPVYRVLDFALGVLLGVVFVLLGGTARRVSFKETALTAAFAAVYIALCMKLYLRVPVGVRYNLLFVPGSLALVWLFASVSGRAAKALSWRGFVYLGDMSPYLFLIHQVVLQSMRQGMITLAGRAESVNVAMLELMWLALSFALTLLLAELYKKLLSVGRRKITR